MSIFTYLNKVAGISPENGASSAALKAEETGGVKQSSYLAGEVLLIAANMAESLPGLRSSITKTAANEFIKALNHAY